MRQGLGRELARFRTAAGFTQAELACRMGFSRSSVVNIETGRQGTSRAMWERLDVLLQARRVLVQAFDAVAEAKAEWDRVGSVVGLVENTFGRGARASAGGSVSDARAAAIRWLVSDRSSVPTVPVGHRIGQVDVARLQTARDRFKAVDNEFGGVAALPS